MNDILQQIMNMIENTRTVPSISSFSMIGFAVLLIFGVINCILGYRLLHRLRLYRSPITISPSACHIF